MTNGVSAFIIYGQLFDKHYYVWYDVIVEVVKVGDYLASKNPVDGKNQLQEIRENIEGYVGQKIVLKANKGRKKTTVREGFLENTYPNIFIVRIDGNFDDHGRRVSYSYSDILTETVEITVCSDNKRIKVS